MIPSPIPEPVDRCVPKKRRGDSSPTPTQLARWQRLAAAATRGPWRKKLGKFRIKDSPTVVWVEAEGEEEAIVPWEGFAHGYRMRGRHRANAAFIAAAREAVPALIAEVEWLRALLRDRKQVALSRSGQLGDDR